MKRKAKDWHPIEELIEKVEKILSYNAYCLSLTCPYSQDDLFEVGRFEAIRAYHTFIPDKGYVHYNWMTIVGYQSMCKEIQKRKRKDPVGVIVKDDLPDYEGKENMEIESLMFREELEQIDSSALEVVEIIFKMPLELFKVMEGGKPKKIRGRLRDLLKQYGWSDRQINESFGEIRRFVLRAK